MNTITTHPTTTPIETLTPEEFAAKYLPILEAGDAEPETPENHFVLNMETGKLELHFTKETYLALSAEDKARIKSSFLWGRNSGCWISRCKYPHTSIARDVAKSLGLFDAGKIGERMSFADQMALKAERAERRADRYENRSDAAVKRGELLQAPINRMHGDIAFFTQPNINTSAGRAFTRRRERMWQSFERGFEEFNKSAYWKDRANIARATADQKELKDKGFVMRRIQERERDLRALRRSIEGCEDKIARIEAASEKGETPRDAYGYEITETREMIEHHIEYWLDRIEVKLDELGFYQDRLEALGGVAFGPDNIKPGYIVNMKRRGNVTVISTGPKNFKHRRENSPIVLTDSYADILKIVKASEAPKEQHPFKVGDSITAKRWVWDAQQRHFLPDEGITVKVIRATEKSVTLQINDEKPFVRKPNKVSDNRWAIYIGDNMPLTDRTWYKLPSES